MKKGETRKFGFIAFLFFGTLSLISVWREHERILWFFLCLSILGLLLLLFPKKLQGIHKGWMAIGKGIGTAVTTFLMGLAYFIVITPASFIKRLFGGRPLAMRIDRKCQTYWVDRPEPAQPKERFCKRY